MEIRLIGKWSSSTEGLSKIIKGNCPSRTDFMFILQWQIPSCAHGTGKGENMGALPRFAALSHSAHRRNWLHVTCASGDTKCVYTWAAERGVGCPKLVTTWASAVLCNQGLQGLISGNRRQDVRLSAPQVLQQLKDRSPSKREDRGYAHLTDPGEL